MSEARLIIDPPAAGSWNMAVDEALLRSAEHSGCLTLRLYQWEVPTLSLGYFQNYDVRGRHAASKQCPVVRRATGGGAIVHDREITYSLTAPVRDRIDQTLVQWYFRIHATWIAALRDFDIQGELNLQTDPERADRFLCFERRSEGDLLLGAAKIGGSAQRRHRRAALQHGSLLLDQSPAAPELPGITQLSGIETLAAEWQKLWLAHLADELGVTWQECQLSAPERAMAEQLDKEKFGSPKWVLRR